MSMETFGLDTYMTIMLGFMWFGLWHFYYVYYETLNKPQLYLWSVSSLFLFGIMFVYLEHYFINIKITLR